MKNVLLNFFADKNLGDDLMIQQLLNRFPDCNFHVSNKKAMALEVFSQYSNFHIQNIRPVRKYDAYILVGGSVLNYSGVSGLIYQVKEILTCLVMRIKGTKCMVIGANLSMIPRKWYRGILKSVLSLRVRLLNLLTLRDEYSYHNIKPYSKGNVFLFPDIVFSCPCPAAPVDLKSGTLGISVFCNRFEFKDDTGVYEKFAEIANEYLRDASKRVFLFAFDTGRLNDKASARRVYEMIRNKEQAEIVSYTGESDSFIGKIASCSCFLPVRFHSLILCLKLGIPFVPFIYSNKTENLLDDIQYKGPRYPLNELSKLNAAYIVTQATGNFPFLTAEQNASLTEKARGHFNLLEQFLKS